MNSLVLAIAGRIGSGKSTLAQGVAAALGWPVVSFGDYVRKVARQQGWEESREVLQEVGAALIATGREEFCRAVLAEAAWAPGQSLVIDGIRHAEVVTTLRRLLAPTPLKLVFVSVAEDIRQARLHTRGNADAAQLPQIEAHSTEIQVEVVLAELADLAVDSAQSREDLVQEIVSWTHEQVNL